MFVLPGKRLMYSWEVVKARLNRVRVSRFTEDTKILASKVTEPHLGLIPWMLVKAKVSRVMALEFREGD